jgi:hypothetical protein
MPISTKPSNAVKADAGEITKTLRWLARETEFVFAAEQLNAAAALIESMQAQLAETKRRLDAAIKDLGEEMPHWACKNKSKDNCSISAFDGRYDCGYCGMWEWRGPQDEKGASN